MSRHAQRPKIVYAVSLLAQVKASHSLYHHPMMTGVLLAFSFVVLLLLVLVNRLEREKVPMGDSNSNIQSRVQVRTSFNAICRVEGGPFQASAHR